MTTTSNADKILEDLFSAAETSQSHLRERTERSSEIIKTIDALGMKAKQVSTIRDDKRRQLAERVLNARLEQVRKDAQQEERDLAEAVVGFQALVEQMGGEYGKLTTFNSTEQGVMDNARQALADAELALAKARTAWFFRGSRTRNAEAGMSNAKQAVLESEVQAKNMQRDRLMSSTMEESFQDLLLRSRRIIDIMKERRETVIRELDSVQKRKSEVMEEKYKASKAMEVLEGEVADKKRDLAEAEEKLVGIPQGPEQVKQNELVSKLRSEHEELVGKYNAALGVFQTADNFAKQFEVHEITQMKLRDNLFIWITVLEKSSKSRVVSMASRLEAMKATADQEVASTLDKVGAEVDLRNTQAMAAMGTAADRARVEMFEDMPERLRDQHAIAVAQVRAHIATDERMRAVIAQYKDNYGIDLLDTSIFNPTNQPANAPAERV